MKFFNVDCNDKDEIYPMSETNASPFSVLAIVELYIICGTKEYTLDVKSRVEMIPLSGNKAKFLIVEDTLDALQKFAAYYRSQFDFPII